MATSNDATSGPKPYVPVTEKDWLEFHGIDNTTKIGCSTQKKKFEMPFKDIMEEMKQLEDYVGLKPPLRKKLFSGVPQNQISGPNSIRQTRNTGERPKVSKPKIKSQTLGKKAISDGIRPSVTPLIDMEKATFILKNKSCLKDRLFKSPTFQIPRTSTLKIAENKRMSKKRSLEKRDISKPKLGQKQIFNSKVVKEQVPEVTLSRSSEEFTRLEESLKTPNKSTVSSNRNRLNGLSLRCEKIEYVKESIFEVNKILEEQNKEHEKNVKMICDILEKDRHERENRMKRIDEILNALQVHECDKENRSIPKNAISSRVQYNMDLRKNVLIENSIKNVPGCEDGKAITPRSKLAQITLNKTGLLFQMQNVAATPDTVRTINELSTRVRKECWLLEDTPKRT